MTELAYVYDGSLEGLLSAIFTAYACKEDPSDVVIAKNLQPRLGQEMRDIESDMDVALRVQKGICRTCGPVVFDAVKSASLSDDPAAGSIVYRFVRYAMAKHKPHDCTGCPRKMRCGGLCTRSQKNSALNDIVHPSVAPFHELNRAVYNERHRMLQFLRFEHMEGDVWFARCNPAASVVPLIMDWFAGRFNTQAFMIYDENHRIAGVYEGKEWYLVKTDSLMLPEHSAEEEVMQAAWKRFYNTIAVESRYNPELRRQFMPKRFWKNITEMKETLPSREITRR
ncbi:TIGR03915 family putative DNA repair protein [Raoultibacter massiliensis]|uniref:TIGR03915 family putative DNA repair protein n=1 Tax=Raoultibacter massiliensis TaxID=1852371 RepID=UPI000C836149|nr:TIGR03915 family putative DNA repair protein [Raoultibacter massiliensis]